MGTPIFVGSGSAAIECFYAPIAVNKIIDPRHRNVGAFVECSHKPINDILAWCLTPAESFRLGRD